MRLSTRAAAWSLGVLLFSLASPPTSEASPPALAGLLTGLPPGYPVQIDDPPSISGFLSPPRVGRPYYLCSSVVSVDEAVPLATVELQGEIDGQPVHLSETASWFGTVTFNLPKPIETTNDWFVAIQDDGVDRSGPDADPSDPAIRAMEPPNPAPAPRVYWSPHYKCGVRAGVTAFLRGSDVSLVGHRDNAPWETLFSRSAVAYHAAEGVSRGYFEGEQLEARYEFCKSGSYARYGASERIEVQPYPIEAVPGGPPGQWRPKAPPTPTVRIVEGFPYAEFGNLWHGATLELLDAAGNVIATGATASPTASVPLGFTPSASGSGQYRPKQSFPGCHSGTLGPLTPVTPCLNLPAPAIRRPNPGDETVFVTAKFSGAVVSVFAVAAAGDPPQNPPLGRGSGSRLRLSRPLTELEHLVVLQTVGNCTSQQGYAIRVGCGADRLGELSYLELLTHRRRRTGGTTLTTPTCQ